MGFEAKAKDLKCLHARLNVHAMYSRPFQMALRLFLVMGVLGMSGGHWLLLQSVAWAQMIADYSREGSVRQAITDTFSGRRPCDMCKAIDKAKEKEQQQQALSLEYKRDLFCEAEPVAIIPSVGDGWAGASMTVWITEARPPPVPPPRLSLG